MPVLLWLETCQKLFLLSSVDQPLSKILLLAPEKVCLTFLSKLPGVPHCASVLNHSLAQSHLWPLYLILLRGTSVPSVSLHVLPNSRPIMVLEIEWNNQEWCHLYRRIKSLIVQKKGRHRLSNAVLLMLFQSCEVTFKSGMSAQELLSQSACVWFITTLFLWEKIRKKQSAYFTGPENRLYWPLPDRLQGGNANSIPGMCGGVQPGLVCGGSPGQLNNIGFPGPPPTCKGLGLSSSPCITAEPCWWPCDTTLDRSHPGTAWEILITQEQQIEIWRPWVVQVHV